VSHDPLSLDEHDLRHVRESRRDEKEQPERSDDGYGAEENADDQSERRHGRKGHNGKNRYRTAHQ